MPPAAVKQDFIAITDWDGPRLAAHRVETILSCSAPWALEAHRSLSEGTSNVGRDKTSRNPAARPPAAPTIGTRSL